MPFRVYFYTSARGAKEVRTFLRALPAKHRVKCMVYLKRVRSTGTNLPTNVVKHLEAGSWEARPEFAGNGYRFFFFVYSNNVGVVSAIVKKRDRLERRIIQTAIRRMEELRNTWQEEENEQAIGLQGDRTTD